MASHGYVGGNIFCMHALRLFDKRLLDVAQRLIFQRFEFAAHALQRPKKIHRGGPGRSQRLADLLKFAAQFLRVARRRIAHAQGHAHGRGHANGGRAAHHHAANGLGHFLISAAGGVGLFRGQLRLVEDAHATGGPFQSLDH